MGRWGYDPDDSDGALDLYFKVEDAVRDETHKAWAGSLYSNYKKVKTREKADSPCLVDRVGVVQRSLEKGYALYRKTVEGARDDLKLVLERNDWFEECRSPVTARKIMEFWLKAFERLVQDEKPRKAKKFTAKRRGASSVIYVTQNPKRHGDFRVYPPKPDPNDRIYPNRDWPEETAQFRRRRRDLARRQNTEDHRARAAAEASMKRRILSAKAVRGPFVAFEGTSMRSGPSKVIANGDSKSGVVSAAKKAIDGSFMVCKKVRGILIPVVRVTSIAGEGYRVLNYRLKTSNRWKTTTVKS